MTPGPPSLRETIGLSLADERTLPGLPPMLIFDHQRMYCSVCGRPAAASEGRHITELDSQLGEGLLTSSFLMGGGEEELPFMPGCGAVWTHYTVRPWLAEVWEDVSDDGRMRARMLPLEQLPGLIRLDP